MVEKEKDIVERLRRRPLISNEEDIIEWAERMDQAADEIERLRAYRGWKMTDIVERLRGGENSLHSGHPSPLDREAADEIERLRAALKKYGEHQSSSCDRYDCWCGFKAALETQAMPAGQEKS